jgi:5-methylcytosine-specific restriction protein A
MADKTAYARTPESESREVTMRALAPKLLGHLGPITEERKVRGMQFVTVEPESDGKMVVWVKCAWKPGKHGNCAVQMAFPGKEERAHTPEEVITIVTEKVERAGQRGATHALLLAADDPGQTPLAAYLVPLDAFSALTEAALAVDVPLTQNGASPSFYVTATGPRQKALVNVVRTFSLDLMAVGSSQQANLDSLDDLDDRPVGAQQPARIKSSALAFQRDPAVRAYVIRRAQGRCEHCGMEGFLMMDGKRYLEAHHIISLADQGPDTVQNVIALCPEHHREAHYGARRNEMETEMVEKLRCTGA